MDEPQANQTGPNARTRVVDGSLSWSWHIGILRIGILAIVALGNYLNRTPDVSAILLGTYLAAAVLSGLYLALVRISRVRRPLLHWAQVVVDFSAVGITIYYTEGPTSVYAFLFVVVIVEAGLLLGLGQGFVFSTAATLFMLIQTYLYFNGIGPARGLSATDPATLIYNFCVQSLAFYLTAFLSGYWRQRINRMEYFHREILDNMNSGFLVTDQHGIVMSLNRVGRAILGLGPGEGAGQPVENVLRVDEESECPILTAIRSQADFSSYEFRALSGRGESKLLGLTTSRLMDPQGRLTAVIASFSDLTEMSKLRQELRRQDRMAAIGELTAGLAHEIRNPVAAIRGAADELTTNVDDTGLAHKLSNIMIRESDHLNKIVTGFLDFAANPFMHRDTFDVRDVVREVETSLLRTYNGASNLRIETHLPEEPCEVDGDETQIRQVFLNLGKNGVEAMNGEGALTISVVKNGGPLEIRFEDEGSGIDPDKVSRIFEPFYTTKKKGVGMGLAVCLRIITNHDGSLRATSRESGGATMHVILPASAKGSN